MYFDDHEPPHFHAVYSGTEVEIGIDPIEVRAGNVPNRAVSMVLEWAALHQRELMDNWRRLRSDQPAQRISPLR
jgi:hypothetical protein